MEIKLWEADDTFEQKMDKLILALHIRVPDTFLGRTKEQWQRLYSEDVHLNNVPLPEWDSRAVSYIMFQGKKNPCRLGWNLSKSELVCAYKHAVINQIVKS